MFYLRSRLPLLNHRLTRTQMVECIIEPLIQKVLSLSVMPHISNFAPIVVLLLTLHNF